MEENIVQNCTLNFIDSIEMFWHISLQIRHCAWAVQALETNTSQGPRETTQKFSHEIDSKHQGLPLAWKKSVKCQASSRKLALKFFSHLKKETYFKEACQFVFTWHSIYNGVMIMSSDDRPKNYENSSSYRRPNEGADDQQKQLLGVTNGCLKGNLTLITGLSIAFTLW